MDLEGQVLRDEGAALADAAALEHWRCAADQAIDRLASRGVEFDAEDLRRELDWPPTRPGAVGAVFLRAAREGRIRHVGYRPARRAEAHSRVLRVWVGTG